MSDRPEQTPDAAGTPATDGLDVAAQETGGQETGAQETEGQAPADDALRVPLEFPAARFKMGLIAMLDFALVMMLVTDGAGGGSAGLIWGAAIFFTAMGAAFAREAADPRPLLRLSDAGIEDRRHGFIPWSDIAWWQMKNAVLTKHFGYSLRPGASVPRNGRLLKLQAAMGALGGRPHRFWPKQMLPSGLEPLAISFRHFAPEKERG